MSDHIDDAVLAAWSDIDKAVQAALAQGPALGTLFGVDTAADATPYRVRQIDWLPQPDIAPGLSRCVVTDVALAYELSLDFGVSVRQLEDTPHTVVEALAALAGDARRAERAAVLSLIIEGAELQARCDVDGLRSVLDNLGGLWRLLGTGSVAKPFTDSGVVEDVVDPQWRFPSGVRALLTKLDNGPTVRTVDTDFRLTWQRVTSPEPAVRFLLTQRFFVEHAGRSIVLT